MAMSFNLSEIGNIKLESVLQQGIDTFFKRQQENKTAQGVAEVPVRKRSLDRDGTLYELPPTNSYTLAAYQIRRQGSKGSIIVTLDHLRKLYQSLNREVLAEAAKGDLSRAEAYLKKQKNIDISHYTHRLKVFRANQAKILIWLIDLDLHKETSDENSYGSGTAKAMLESLMGSFLDEPKALEHKNDYLDVLVEEDWVAHLAAAARPFYNHSQLSYKLVFRKPPRFAF
ncbi:unknown protein [Synechocystis sp. LKSZ1]